MRFLLVLFISFCSYFSCTAQTSWKKAYEKDGLLIHTRTSKDGLFEFKSDKTMSQAIEKILSVIRDYKAYPEWSYKTKSLRILERINPDTHYAYTVVDFPFPMKDRDLITYSETTYEANGNLIISLKSVPDKIAKTEYVRINKVRGFWKLIPLSDNKTRVIYQLASESVGLPNWLVEMFALEAPIQNMSELGKRAAKVAD
ncbi:MAG: START domain-containing protein [Bacteroidota bacterium]